MRTQAKHRTVTALDKEISTFKKKVEDKYNTMQHALKSDCLTNDMLSEYNAMLIKLEAKQQTRDRIKSDYTQMPGRGEEHLMNLFYREP